MKNHNPFRYFKTSPEIIRLAVMMYVRFPLSLRNVEELLQERGVDICHETVAIGGIGSVQFSLSSFSVKGMTGLARVTSRRYLKASRPRRWLMGNMAEREGICL